MLTSRSVFSIKEQYLLLIAFSLLFLLYLIPASKLALWMDDFYSLSTAEAPIFKIIQRCRIYQSGGFDHPPFYFMLLHFVLAINNSPLYLRFPSIVFALLGIWMIVKILKLWEIPFLYRITGIFIVGLHPVIFFQSVTVRMYTMFLFLTFMILYIIFSVELNGRFSLGRKVFLVLTLTVLLYTTYFGIIFAIGLGLYALFLILPGFIPLLRRSFLCPVWEESSLTFAGKIFKTLIAASIFIIPWAPTYINLLEAEGKVGAQSGVIQTGLLRSLWTSFSLLTGTWYGIMIFLLGFILLVIYSRERWKVISLFISFILWPVLVILTLKPEARAFEPRYCIYSIGVLYILAAKGFYHYKSQNRSRLIRWVIFLLVLLTLISFAYANYQNHILLPRPNWWGVAKVIEQNVLPHEFILTGGYLSGEALVYHLDHPERFSFIHYVTDYVKFKKMVENPGIIWYVNAAPLPEPFKELVDQWFPYQWNCPGNGYKGVILVASKKKFQYKKISPTQNRSRL